MEAISDVSYIRSTGPVAELSEFLDELWTRKISTVKHLRSYGDCDLIFYLMASAIENLIMIWIL